MNTITGTVVVWDIAQELWIVIPGPEGVTPDQECQIREAMPQAIHPDATAVDVATLSPGRNVRVLSHPAFDLDDDVRWLQGHTPARILRWGGYRGDLAEGPFLSRTLSRSNKMVPPESSENVELRCFLNGHERQRLREMLIEIVYGKACPEVPFLQTVSERSWWGVLPPGSANDGFVVCVREYDDAYTIQVYAVSHTKSISPIVRLPTPFDVENQATLDDIVAVVKEAFHDA